MDELTLTYIGIGILALQVIWVVIFSLLGSKIRKLSDQLRSYEASTGIPDLAQLITELKQQSVRKQEQIGSMDSRVKELEHRLKRQRGKTGIIRYHAFSEQGNDLSFSLAVLNEEQDGYVLSAIHSREESYVYAKPLVKGSSPYPISPEEKEAIRQALQDE